MKKILNISASTGELSALPSLFSCSDWHGVGLLLRDFYMFPQADTLPQLINKIEKYCRAQVTFPVLNINDDWRDAEYDFNRLFVGPQALLAPPYASAYLETEPQLMGNSTQEIRGLLHALGLSVRDENQIPDDHISYEIELCLVLIKQAPQQPIYQEALAWLVSDHMGHWLPKFIANSENQAQTPLLLAITRVLSLWFNDLQRRIS
jgi:TorA maturation chaperone TorD